MKRHAVVGVGLGIHGREAAMQATQRALDQASMGKVALALVFFAQEFAVAEVQAGVAGLLGETPLWGFSTVSPLTGAGDCPRSVVVALVLGVENQAVGLWYPGFPQDSSGTARQLAQTLSQANCQYGGLLLAADGINGSMAPLCSALGELSVDVAGAMASGDPSLGCTYQMSKNQAGPGGLAVLALGGRLTMASGLGHGWRDLGVYARATRTRDVWVESLDQAPAAETYARLFGNTAPDWALPPLAEIVRLYPLGMEMQPGSDAQLSVSTDPANLQLRSPLRVEADGSLRMSAPVAEHTVLHMMTGDPDACLQAADSAARTALQALDSRCTPLLAVAFVDAAWHMLFETRPSAVAEAVQAAVGDLPVIGAYTFGQLARVEQDQPPVLFNQHIAVVVLAERQEESSSAD